MKIDLYVDTDDLPANVIVIERSQHGSGWVFRCRGQPTDQPPDVYTTLERAITYADQRLAGPCTLIVREF
jgi:hypothetical protein